MQNSQKNITGQTQKSDTPSNSPASAVVQQTPQVQQTPTGATPVNFNESNPPKQKRIKILLVVVLFSVLTSVFAFNLNARNALLKLLPEKGSTFLQKHLQVLIKKIAIPSAQQEAEKLFTDALEKISHFDYISGTIIVPLKPEDPAFVLEPPVTTFDKDFIKKILRTKIISTHTVHEDASTTFISIYTVENLEHLNGIYSRSKDEFSSNDQRALNIMLASTKRNFSENFTKWIYIKKDTLQNEVLFDDRTSKYHVKDLDLTNLFRLQPDSFSILSTREEVDNGKNLVHYKVHLKDGLKSEYISSSVALFLSSSTIDIIIDKDLSTVQGLAIQHDDITTFFNIITVGTDPHIVDIPEKYITWEQRLEQKETWRARDPEDLPGFISATSTSYIGGNSSLGTSLDRSYKKIIIIPLGDVPPSDIKLITNALTSTFNAVSVEVASTVPLSQDMESASSSPKEKQYLYESLLKKMVKPYKDDSQILIGVLAADGTFSGRNFAHSLTFFDPEYDQPPSGVFSTFRIKNKIDQKITQLRYQKILQRIVGISVGLRPAASLNCPTAQAISLTAIDSKGTKWCGDDELLLQKVGLLKAQ